MSGSQTDGPRGEAGGIHPEFEREFLASIISGTDDAVIGKDLDGRIIIWNRAAEEMYGYTAEEAVGQNTSMLVPDDRQAELAEIMENIRNGRRVEQIETVRLHKDGTPIDVALTVSPVMDAGGRCMGASSIARDITDRRRAERELRESRERYTMAVSAGRIGVWDLDLETDQLFVDRYFNRLLGFEEGELELDLAVWLSLVEEDYRDKAAELISQVRRGETESFEVELPMKKKDGERAWFLVSAKVLEEPGEHRRLFGTAVDITDRKKLEQKLRVQATVDGLTGVFVRRHFLERVAEEIRRSQRYGNSICVIIFDIDHFKRINDSHGHQAGDAVLRQVREICEPNLRDTDFIGRLGGEEFGVMLVECRLDRGRKIAERLRRAVESSPVDSDGVRIDFTVSLGVAEYRAGEDTVDSLLGRADKALYEAKDGGRNQVVAFGGNSG